MVRRIVVVAFLYAMAALKVPMLIPVLFALIVWVLSISVFNIYVRTVYYTSLYIWSVSTEEAAEVGGKVWVPAPLADSL